MMGLRNAAGVGVDELEAVYRSCYPRFLRVATAIAGSEQSGGDAVQDAFVSALRHRGQFQGRGTVESWLWSILINAARSSRRIRQAVPSSTDGPGQANARGDDEGALTDSVRLVVARLPERQRLALFLRYYADLDYRAIAAALGVKEGTVSATLSAAHAAVRNSLVEVNR